MSLHDHRDFYARLVVAKGGSDDARLIDAFRAVDRHAFVGPGPWKVFTASGYVDTPGDDPAFVFQDEVIALKPEHRINNGEPSLHARCLAAADAQAGQRVIHVGAGSGYYTAVLAQLVGDGRIDAYEVDSELAEIARRRLADRPNVVVHHRSALETALPTTDLIYVNAGVSAPPAPWLDALAPGGRLIFPLTAGQGPGLMLRLTRQDADVYAVTIISGAAFIPCVGGQDETQAKALLAAFATGRHGALRSLRRSGDPDDTAWLAGDGWWFSTREAESSTSSA
jgi:protein-L-isoaspartate(D-aspartate) O-methyltransferase